MNSELVLYCSVDVVVMRSLVLSSLAQAEVMTNSERQYTQKAHKRSSLLCHEYLCDVRGRSCICDAVFPRNSDCSTSDAVAITHSTLAVVSSAVRAEKFVWGARVSVYGAVVCVDSFTTNDV